MTETSSKLTVCCTFSEEKDQAQKEWGSDTAPFLSNMHSEGDGGLPMADGGWRIENKKLAMGFPIVDGGPSDCGMRIVHRGGRIEGRKAAL